MDAYDINPTIEDSNVFKYTDQKDETSVQFNSVKDTSLSFGAAPINLKNNYTIGTHNEIESKRNNIINVIDIDWNEAVAEVNPKNPTILNTTGDLIRWIRTKVDKEEGMGLSSNDFTNEDAEKLEQLEPNVIEKIKVNGEALTVDSIDKSVNIEISQIPTSTNFVKVLGESDKGKIYFWDTAAGDVDSMDSNDSEWIQAWNTDETGTTYVMDTQGRMYVLSENGNTRSWKKQETTSVIIVDVLNQILGELFLLGDSVQNIQPDVQNDYSKIKVLPVFNGEVQNSLNNTYSLTLKVLYNGEEETITTQDYNYSNGYIRFLSGNQYIGSKCKYFNIKLDKRTSSKIYSVEKVIYNSKYNPEIREYPELTSASAGQVLTVTGSGKNKSVIWSASNDNDTKYNLTINRVIHGNTESGATSLGSIWCPEQLGNVGAVFRMSGSIPEWSDGKIVWPLKSGIFQTDDTTVTVTGANLVKGALKDDFGIEWNVGSIWKCTSSDAQQQVWQQLNKGIPDYTTSTDLNKVLTITSSGLSWVTPSSGGSSQLYYTEINGEQWGDDSGKKLTPPGGIYAPTSTGARASLLISNGSDDEVNGPQWLAPRTNDFILTPSGEGTTKQLIWKSPSQMGIATTSDVTNAVSAIDVGVKSITVNGSATTLDSNGNVNLNISSGGGSDQNIPANLSDGVYCITDRNKIIEYNSVEPGDGNTYKNQLIIVDNGIRFGIDARKIMSKAPLNSSSESPSNYINDSITNGLENYFKLCRKDYNWTNIENSGILGGYDEQLGVIEYVPSLYQQAIINKKFESIKQALDNASMTMRLNSNLKNEYFLTSTISSQSFVWTLRPEQGVYTDSTNKYITDAISNKTNLSNVRISMPQDEQDDITRYYFLIYDI